MVRRALCATLFPYTTLFRTIGKDRGWAPFSKEVFLNTTRPEGAYFMGEHNAVIDKILQQHEWFGHTRFVGQKYVVVPDPKMILQYIIAFLLRLWCIIRYVS